MVDGDLPEVFQELTAEAEELPDNFYRYFLLEFDENFPYRFRNMEIIARGARRSKGESFFEDEYRDNIIKIKIAAEDDLTIESLRNRLRDRVSDALKNYV